MCLRGSYEFSELHLAAYFAFMQTCAEHEYGDCMCPKDEIPSCRDGDHHPVQAMWLRWQKHRLHPDHHFADVGGLLNGWGAYVPQLLYYITSTFSSDQFYKKVLANTRLADVKYYTSAFYAGKRGRYGTTEGPVANFCDGFQKEYAAMYMPNTRSELTPGFREGLYRWRANDKAVIAHCYAYSAATVFGYMPVSSFVEGHAMNLLEDGEAIIAMPQSGDRAGNGKYAIPWRQSLYDPTIFHRGLIHITLVDLATAFWGLASLWLPAEFFQRHGTLKIKKQQREVMVALREYLDLKKLRLSDVLNKKDHLLFEGSSRDDSRHGALGGDVHQKVVAFLLRRRMASRLRRNVALEAYSTDKGS